MKKKKKITLKFVLLSICLVLSALYFSEEYKGDIVDVNYFCEGHKHYSEYDPDYGTTTQARFKYESGHIFIQMEICSWRFKGWDHVWLDDSNGRRIGYWDVERTRSGESYVTKGHQAYRKEMPWIEIDGIKPNMPQGCLKKNGERFDYDFSGTPNKTASFTFDYFYTGSNNNVSFEPSQGCAFGVNDFLTGFYYVIDESPDTKVNEDNAVKNTDGHLDVTDYVNSDKNYYIHIKSKSYTGKLSDQLDAAIEKYHIEYNGNCENKDFSFNQSCLVDEVCRICDAENVDTLKGYVFCGWNTQKDGSGMWYYPCDEVINIALPGEKVILYAQWEQVWNFVVYDMNGGYPDDKKIWGFNAADENYYAGCSSIKTGYSFSDWNLTRDGSKESFKPGEKIKNDDGLTYIKSVAGENYCIDAYYNGKENLTNISTWICNNGNEQKFAFEYAGEENGVRYYRIRCANGSGKVFDVFANAPVNGQNVSLYTYNGCDGQLWSLEYAKDDYFYIKSKLGNYYLSLDGNEAVGNVCILEKNEEKLQMWKLDTISHTVYAQWKKRGFELIKASSDLYNELLIKRTEDDKQWYDTLGKMTCKEAKIYPDELCCQVWEIDNKGDTKRIK